MDYADKFLTQKEKQSQPSPAKRLAFFNIITVIALLLQQMLYS